MMQVPEEPTEVNITQLLESLPKELNPLERLILSNYGTVQTLLSVVYGTPVKVKVLSQHDFGDVIVRWSRLYAVIKGGSAKLNDIHGAPSDETVNFPDKEVTVCLAESIIPKKDNPSGFMSAIREKKMGIGQVIKACCLNTERLIIGLFADDNQMARNYTIRGDANLLITETFPRFQTNVVYGYAPPPTLIER